MRLREYNLNQENEDAVNMHAWTNHGLHSWNRYVRSEGNCGIDSLAIQRFGELNSCYHSFS